MPPVLIAASPWLALSSTAARKRSWRQFARSRDDEELGDPCVKSERELFEQRHRRILEAALQSADIRAVDVCIDREVFLRKTSPDPQPPQVPRHKRLRLHRRRRTA